ncbi:MAG: PD-(D/E)XK nuclease family protein [Deltaproteobacteria bacterium]|nr:PD-(D/E)XK nuclease family protein [Deltaproteobacteria bacterium]
MGVLKVLPPPLAEVVPPKLFTVSGAVKAQECVLAGVLASDSSISGAERLAPVPKARLGTVLHRLVEDSAKGKIQGTGDVGANVSHHFDVLLKDAEVELSQSEYATMVPLRASVGEITFRNRVRDAKQRALEVLNRSLPRPPHAASSAPTSGGLPRNASELWLESGELRLRGRTDLLSIDGSRVLIEDFKTGDVDVEDASPQLVLYALLAVAQRPGSSVEIAVLGGTRKKLSAEDLAAARASLKSKTDQASSGAATLAEHLASPGSMCRHCDFRHRCRAYQTWAVSTWANPSAERKEPLDTWGVVLRIERPHVQWVTIRIRDDAGREVDLVKIDASLSGVQQLSVGARFYAFGVAAAASSRDAGGLLVHPRAFRELGNGDMQRAWPSFFVGTGA